MELHSPAFDDGAELPVEHTRDGRDRSPPLAWSAVPEGTRELAILLQAEQPLTLPEEERFTFWVAYGIAGDRRELPAGFGGARDPEEPADILQGTNDNGLIGYQGPAGTAGRTLRYAFRLFALGSELRAGPGLSKDELRRRIEGRVLGEATLHVQRTRPRA